MRNTLFVIGLGLIALFLLTWVASALLFVIPLATGPGTIPHRTIPVILLIVDRITFVLFLLGIVCCVLGASDD